MIRESSSRSSLVAWGLAAATGALLLTGSAKAHADDVPATGKGITGGALLGGEVVMVTEAALGVKPGWAYLVGGVLGAGAGALGGYYVERDGSAQASVYMLAGGMALVIPTTVAILQATSYQPPEDYTEDRPPPGTPIAEPPRQPAPATAPGAPPITPAPATAPAAPAPATAPAAPAPAPAPASLHYHWEPGRMAMPLALLDLTDGAPRMGVPAVELRPVYSQTEIAKYGLAQQHELRLPILSATF